ncbi:hypothetical protein FHL15_007080 [Xylaria flabelliformis]|uniref:Uncharacterized protein n=1 Tax=Xylaria flabelliformis TaxID=2512241 RepID=A0A553HVK5_9PEZI|nr:hypothetical protein FHL15_007080 [Xylaria flabelliformis]
MANLQLHDRDKYGVYLLNALLSRTPSSTKEDFAGEVKELSCIASEELLLAISPIGYNSKGDKNKCLLERVRKRLSTFWSKKRMKIEQRLDPDDNDTVVVGSSMFRTTHLACPFYIRQKKRHLGSCHNTYVLSEDWEDRVRLRSCTSSSKPPPEGVSALQMQRLARPDDPWTLRETQWLLIWETVFPGVELPSLPFLFGEVETVVWMLRYLWSAEGDRIVCGFLSERRQQTLQPQKDEPNVMILGQKAMKRGARVGSNKHTHLVLHFGHGDEPKSFDDATMPDVLDSFSSLNGDHSR